MNSSFINILVFTFLIQSEGEYRSQEILYVKCKIVTMYNQIQTEGSACCCWLKERGPYPFQADNMCAHARLSLQPLRTLPRE